MSSSACGRCPTLQAQVARLTSELNAAQRQVALLREHVGVLMGAVSSTLALIRAQLEKATMKRLDLIRHIHGRLQTAVDLVTGRR